MHVCALMFVDVGPPLPSVLPGMFLRRQVGLPRFLAFRPTYITLFTPFRGFLWRGRLACNKIWTLLWASAEGRLNGWGDMV